MWIIERKRSMSVNMYNVYLNKNTTSGPIYAHFSPSQAGTGCWKITMLLVNILLSWPLNKLVKLTMLWTTGPRSIALTVRHTGTNGCTRMVSKYLLKGYKSAAGIAWCPATALTSSEVTILNLCMSSSHVLYLYQVLRNYLEWYQGYRVDLISILKITKGNNSAKRYDFHTNHIQNHEVA